MDGLLHGGHAVDDPHTPQQYLDLMHAVNRDAFAVHIDVTNWVYCPRTHL